MSKQIKLENSKLFIELSEQEQEGVSGGFSFLLQQTDISTFANNKSTLAKNLIPLFLDKKLDINYRNLPLNLIF